MDVPKSKIMATIYRALRTALKLLLRRGVRNSYGQFGEDSIVQTILKSKRGFYVDVGAFDPVLYSNTYAFYRRGWSGIVIDPNAELAPLYRLFRRRDRFILTAIGNGGEGTYFAFDDASYNTFNEEDSKRWQDERGVTMTGSSRISFRPLKDIVNELKVENIDFMNVDVEGMDLAVLQSHDWSIPPRTIAVEDSSFDPNVPTESATYAFLLGKGYQLRGFSKQTLVFVRQYVP